MQGQRDLRLQVAGLGGPVLGGLRAVVGEGGFGGRRFGLRPEAAGVEGLNVLVAEVVVGQLHVFLAAQGAVVVGQPGIEVAQRTLQNPLGGGILAGIERTQLLQLAETGHDELADVAVGGHFLEPRERAVGQLHALELGQRPLGFGLQAGFVEQLDQAGQPGGFALRVAHPGRFLEQQVLQLLVLSQLAFEGVALGGRAVLRLARPLGQHGFEAGIGFQNPGREQVGVEAAEGLLGALVGVLHQVGQALHGVPSGVGRQLQRERVVAPRGAAGARQLRQLELAGARPHDGQRQALGDEDAVGQHGQGVFFPVGIASCLLFVVSCQALFLFAFAVVTFTNN